MLSRVKELYSLDESAGEKNTIIEAANRLGIGEFQLFQLAYTDWFGHEAEIKPLESVFFGYLVHDQAAFWVLHFARRVIDLDSAGALEASSAFYHRYDPSTRPQSRRTGVFKIIAVVVFFVAYLGVSMIRTSDSRSFNGTFDCLCTFAGTE